MELITPSGNLSFRLADMMSHNDKPIDVAAGSGRIVQIPLPDEADVTVIDDFALLVRYLSGDPAQKREHSL